MPGLSGRFSILVQHFQHRVGIDGLPVSDYTKFPGGKVPENRNPGLEPSQGQQRATRFRHEAAEKILELAVTGHARWRIAGFVLEYEQGAAGFQQGQPPGQKTESGINRRQMPDKVCSQQEIQRSGRYRRCEGIPNDISHRSRMAIHTVQPPGGDPMVGQNLTETAIAAAEFQDPWEWDNRIEIEISEGLW
jgi:hypothetical protein